MADGITNANIKGFSGDYNDLANAPAIPSKAADINAASPAKTAVLTLTAAGWSNGTQTLSNANIAAASPGSLRIAQSATAEQYAAFGAAMPQAIAQAAGSITVRANGTVPAIDIPVELEVRS